MKDTFTVKEIMAGTGLSRQRVHALIKNRNIPVIKENKHFLLKWQDLFKLSSNSAMLGFLTQTLENEKKQVEDGYQNLREQAKAMGYAYVLLMEKGLPTPDGEDLNWIKQFREAYYFWWRLVGWSGNHWSLEAEKYDFLDDGIMN